MYQLSNVSVCFILTTDSPLIHHRGISDINYSARVFKEIVTKYKEVTVYA